MAVLLDTHILLDLLASGRSAEGAWGSERIHVSVASIWEIAIKVRQAKLALPLAVPGIEERLTDLGWSVLPIGASHVTVEVSPWPETHDPFDRLLLAVCEVEDLRLVTRDRKLVDHPLAWRAGAA